MWEDELCPWHPALEALSALVTPHCPELPTPCVLIQLLDCGKVAWMEREVHNYARLLQTAIPKHPALLAVKADLAALCAYSVEAPLAASFTPDLTFDVRAMLKELHVPENSVLQLPVLQTCLRA